MGFIIESGTGNGYSAEVGEHHRLYTQSIIEEEQFFANKNGNMYSIIVDATTSAGDDQFFYMKNTGDADLFIASIGCFVSADTEIKILANVTGTPTAASTITPVNRNLGSGKLLTATINQGADLQMTGGDILDVIYINTADGVSTQKFFWVSKFIVPKNRTICFESSAAATINMTISCFEYST